MMASSWAVSVGSRLRIATNYLVLNNLCQAPGPKGPGLPRGLEQQILEVEAEVGGGGDGAHLGLIDRAVRVQGEGDVRVGAELAVGPARDEGVVLPVLEIARQQRRVRKGDRERSAAL